MTQGCFLETIGLEIEGIGFERNELANLLVRGLGEEDFRLIQVTRDASVELNSKAVNQNTRIFDQDFVSKLISGKPRIVTGYELITQPLYFETLERVLPKIINVLISRGEILSERASFHVHVGFAHNFSLIKNAFSIGYWLEPLLFKLGGMGKKFRGHINNSIYCRPLELGVGVPGEDKKNHNLLVVKEILKAKNVADFWQCYGINVNTFIEEPNRYHPARYFGFNLLSVLIHGTLEFRYFNQCLNPPWMLAVSRLCQAITELSTKATQRWIDSLRKESILDIKNDNIFFYLLEELECAFEQFDVVSRPSRYYSNILRKIITATPTPEFNEIIPMTHLKQYILRNVFLESDRHPIIEKTCESGFLDIHNIGERYVSAY